MNLDHLKPWPLDVPPEEIYYPVGNGINLGPTGSAPLNYGFTSLSGVKEYISQRFVNAQYPIEIVHFEDKTYKKGSY